MVRPSERARTARHLLRSTRSATLATTKADQPYAALVTPACLPSGDIVLLLSDLSEHTRQLREQPLCALLCVGEALGAGLVNPQTRPRLSVMCRAALDGGGDLRTRYLNVHPYAAKYADFADFRFWRLQADRAQFVGGFAQAWTLSAEDLKISVHTAAPLQAMEPRVLWHCNEHQSTAIRSLGRMFGGVEGAWRVVGIDADGCDLLAPEGAARISWPNEVASAEAIYATLDALAQPVQQLLP